MITKYEKLLWAAYGVVLVILYMMSSTDLIIKEKKPEVYPVSVIVEDSTDDNYVNFRKGMEQAAMEMNVDVSFITLYDSGDRSSSRSWRSGSSRKEPGPWSSRRWTGRRQQGFWRTTVSRYRW